MVGKRTRRSLLKQLKADASRRRAKKKRPAVEPIVAPSNVKTEKFEASAWRQTSEVKPRQIEEAPKPFNRDLWRRDGQ